MNLYLLVEGRQTERVIYPAWLKYLAPHMVRVNTPLELQDNNYFLISGEGYPRMLDVKLNDSLRDINQHGSVDNFWVVLDSDGEDISNRREDVYKRILGSGIDIGECRVEVIIQNPCIETWGLGNKSMIAVNQLHGSMSELYRHYDVKNDDPELMKKQDGFIGTDAGFHEKYLKEMLSINSIRYTKKNPNGLKENYYLNKIIERATSEEEHLGSFLYFYRRALEL
ncbi:hypothetical protein LQ939_15030 [Pantoea alhagi]|uniref:hypothetical protein n=1 Tax=Pantoea alhagi TaxID=1891675 RepID=UPI00202B6F67|nr:hypothetical protein [Pantoea alhagi]URQ60039.1 hypothetical protein LQ939_15030 [Pantoea alhagi]